MDTSAWHSGKTQGAGHNPGSRFEEIWSSNSRCYGQGCGDPRKILMSNSKFRSRTEWHPWKQNRQTGARLSCSSVFAYGVFLNGGQLKISFLWVVPLSTYDRRPFCGILGCEIACLAVQLLCDCSPQRNIGRSSHVVFSSVCPGYQDE